MADKSEMLVVPGIFLKIALVFKAIFLVERERGIYVCVCA